MFIIIFNRAQKFETEIVQHEHDIVQKVSMYLYRVIFKLCFRLKELKNCKLVWTRVLYHFQEMKEKGSCSEQSMTYKFTVLSRLPKHVQISDLKGQIYELKNKSSRKQVRLMFIAHLVPLVSHFRNNLI